MCRIVVEGEGKEFGILLLKISNWILDRRILEVVGFGNLVVVGWLDFVFWDFLWCCSEFELIVYFVGLRYSVVVCISDKVVF